MTEIQKKLLASYVGIYHATKDWDYEIDMIKLRQLNETFKMIYAEQL